MMWDLILIILSFVIPQKFRINDKTNLADTSWWKTNKFSWMTKNVIHETRDYF